MKKELEYNVNVLKKKKAIIIQENKHFSDNLSKLTSETTNFGMIKEVILI